MMGTGRGRGGRGTMRTMRWMGEEGEGAKGGRGKGGEVCVGGGGGGGRGKWKRAAKGIQGRHSCKLPDFSLLKVDHNFLLSK